MTSVCTICGSEPARPGLKTGAACAVRYAAAARERRERRRAERLPPAPPRFTVVARKPRTDALPDGFRAARGTRYAVDSAGLRALRRGPDRRWHPVDFERAPLVRRAMAALLARAWGQPP